MTDRKKVFDYLEQLRSMGTTNMWGASRYIQRQFPEIGSAEAKQLLLDWMKSKEEEDHEA